MTQIYANPVLSATHRKRAVRKRLFRLIPVNSHILKLAVVLTAESAYQPVLLVQSRKFKQMDHKLMNEIGRNAETKPPNSTRIREIKEQIAELKKRWPAHSTPPGLMLRLDELEEQLANELSLAKNEKA